MCFTIGVGIVCLGNTDSSRAVKPVIARPPARITPWNTAAVVVANSSLQAVSVMTTAAARYRGHLVLPAHVVQAEPPWRAVLVAVTRLQTTGLDGANVVGKTVKMVAALLGVD